jgi:lysophospholipase L1-like esterase
MPTYSLGEAPLEIAGAATLEPGPDGVRPRRLPRDCWHLLDLMTQFAQRSPSGVRITLRTDSTSVALTMTPMMLEILGLREEPRLPAVDLVVDGELVATREQAGGRTLRVDLANRNNVELLDGDPVCMRFEGLGRREKNLELWLPPSGDTALASLELADGASLGPVRDTRRRWLHYGSSISQCSEATSPARIWPAIAARRAGLHLIPLGLGGSCHLDPYVARFIRDLAADMISLKLGINVVNLASFKERTFVPAVHGFLDTLRDGHPRTPILVASPIFCPSAEERPGPTDLRDGRFVAVGDPADVARGALTLRRIRELLAEAVAVRRERGDANLHYLDGLELFGKDDAHDLPDGLHPNGGGYERIGERFYERVFAAGGILSSGP